MSRRGLFPSDAFLSVGAKDRTCFGPASIANEPSNGPAQNTATALPFRKRPLILEKNSKPASIHSSVESERIFRDEAAAPDLRNISPGTGWRLEIRKKSSFPLG